MPPAERSIKTPPKGGYAELQKKQNQPPQYKEYTIGDYRRLKKEIKTLNLGKLGPDLDTQERIQKVYGPVVWCDMNAALLWSGY